MELILFVAQINLSSLPLNEIHHTEVKNSACSLQTADVWVLVMELVQQWNSGDVEKIEALKDISDLKLFKNVFTQLTEQTHWQ